MAVTNSNYLGPSGEDAVSAELLRHGYNTAQFRLDEGVDFLVSDSTQDLFFLVQVKSTLLTSSGQQLLGHYLLSREQLRKTSRLPFFYVFVLFLTKGTRFVVVPRKELVAIRLKLEQTEKKEASTDTINLRLYLSPNGEISGWGQSFSSFEGFERYFPMRSHSAK